MAEKTWRKRKLGDRMLSPDIDDGLRIRPDVVGGVAQTAAISHIDIAHARAISESLARDGRRPPVIVDNTMLGPVFSTPLVHGADIVVTSLTKYVGGLRPDWRWRKRRQGKQNADDLIADLSAALAQVS